MKLRLFATVLALSLIVWAQENPTTSTPNATPKPEAKGCCHHASDAKDAMGCCHHSSADAKDAMDCCAKDKCQMKDKSCCAGMAMKDAKSCCAGKDMKACVTKCKKNGCCANGKCCGAAGE